MEGRVTLEMNARLLRPCSIEEVSQALHFTGPLKAPGSDGFSAFFINEIGLILARRYVYFTIS
jgi:hypothetical protein